MVGDVIANQPTQVRFTQCDDGIKDLPAAQRGQLPTQRSASDKVEAI
jgi:hypothetical protein